MGLTLAEYEQLVQDLGFDGVDTNIAGRAINNARQRVCRDGRWTFMSEPRDQSLATTANDPDVVASGITGFLRPDAVRLLDGTDPVPLAFKSYQELREMQTQDPDTGQPVYWTVLDGTLIFYPTPDRAYTIDLDYSKVPADLSGATEDVLPEHLSALVQWAAAVDLAARQRDWAAASAFDRHYKDTLLPAAFSQDKTLQRQNSRKVRRTGMWGGI